MRERSMRVSHGQKENQEENFGEYAQQFYNDFLALAFVFLLVPLIFLLLFFFFVFLFF